VTIEPHLQPLTGEVMLHNSANIDDGACLDFAMYGFGEAVSRRHLYMSGCSTYAPNRIARILSHLYIGDMSRRKGDCMSRGYLKWNVLLSPHFSLLCWLLEVWTELLPHSTRDLTPWSVRRGTLSTVKPWTGFVATWVLLC